MLAPPVSAVYCRPVFLCFFRVNLFANVILQRWTSLPNTCQITLKTTGFKILLNLDVYVPVTISWL